MIPTRRNGRPWKATAPGAQARHEILRATRHFGRAIWRTWSGYHQQSCVETKMQCLKLLGERLMAFDFDRQTIELHIGAAFLNGFTRLGMLETQRVA